jgi:hypothetical protein
MTSNRMKKDAVDVDAVVIKQGVNTSCLRDWYAKGTRLIVMATAGE